MPRDSIVDDAERKRQQTAESAEQATEPDESEDDTDSESTDESERVRLTQRMSPDLATKVDAVQERYQLPSRNATINFILSEGIDQLLDNGERP